MDNLQVCLIFNSKYNLTKWTVCVGVSGKIIHSLSAPIIATTQLNSTQSWGGYILDKCALLFISGLAITTPINLAMPHSTPIYWGSKATLNFHATPQSTLVFFGTKAKPFSTITFYSSHPFSLPCHTPLLSTVGLRPHPFLQTLAPSLRITEKWPFSQDVTLQDGSCHFTRKFIYDQSGQVSLWNWPQTGSRYGT